MQAHIRGQQISDRPHVAASRRSKECFSQLQAALSLNFESRSLSPNMRARAVRELAAGRRIALQRRGDLFEIQSEYIVQEKRSALQRRKPLQYHQEWQGNIVRLLLLLDDWFGQPGANVGFPRMPS